MRIDQARVKASELVEKVTVFSDTRLVDKSALKEIIAVMFECGNEPQLKELTFTAKYILGVLRGVDKLAGNPEVNNLQFLKNELADQIKKFASLLQNYLSLATEKEILLERYFGKHENAFANIQMLISDLEWVKMFFNDGNSVE
jgi:hypothetical protein